MAEKEKKAKNPDFHVVTTKLEVVKDKSHKKKKKHHAEPKKEVPPPQAPAPAPTSEKLEQKKVDKTQDFNIETSKLEAVEDHQKEIKVKVEQKQAEP